MSFVQYGNKPKFNISSIFYILAGLSMAIYLLIPIINGAKFSYLYFLFIATFLFSLAVGVVKIIKVSRNLHIIAYSFFYAATILYVWNQPIIIVKTLAYLETLSPFGIAEGVLSISFFGAYFIFLVLPLIILLTYSLILNILSAAKARPIPILIKVLSTIVLVVAIFLSFYHTVIFITILDLISSFDVQLYLAVYTGFFMFLSLALSVDTIILTKKFIPNRKNIKNNLPFAKMPHCRIYGNQPPSDEGGGFLP